MVINSLSHTNYTIYFRENQKSLFLAILYERVGNMFKLTIKTKVFIILILLTVVMIVGMALNMHIGFNKGFFNYRKALDKQFNDNVVNTLESYYQENGSWDDLRENKRLWHDLINQSSVEILNDGQFNQPNIRPHPNRPPPKRPPPKRQPRRHQQSETNRGSPDNKGGPKNQRFRTQQLPPINLYDINKELIIGSQSRNKSRIKFRPIKFESENVGYLGTINDRNIHYKQDKMFAANIQNMLIKLGLLMIVLAFVITFPIAKYFTRLINQLSVATKKVAAGDFSTRIVSDRNDELGDLATNFNLLAQTLESNSESQKHIIADIAHELRTPISVIIGEIEAIQDGIHEANDNTMNLLHSQISTLKNLVNDLHDLSESDLGSLKYKMQKFDISQLLEQCYQNYKLRFSHKNISLELKTSFDDCFILGDINRLNQLFNNVLSNSIQYTDEGGKALIELICHDESIEIKISDSAPKIHNDQLEKIFDRWYRGEKSRNKNLGGSGIGLSICKEIVKAHNGTITANQSKLGGIEILIKFHKNHNKIKDRIGNE